MNLDTAKREVLTVLRGATGRAHVDRMVATSDVRDRLPAAVDACLESGLVTYRDGQRVNLTGGMVRRVAALYLTAAGRKALASGRCTGGCSLWRCGRAAGHEGVCQP